MKTIHRYIIILFFLFNYFNIFADENFSLDKYLYDLYIYDKNKLLEYQHQNIKDINDLTGTYWILDDSQIRISEDNINIPPSDLGFIFLPNNFVIIVNIFIQRRFYIIDDTVYCSFEYINDSIYMVLNYEIENNRINMFLQWAYCYIEDSFLFIIFEDEESPRKYRLKQYFDIYDESYIEELKSYKLNE
jgi:hypothetical protein